MTSVLMVEDQVLIRNGLKLLLEADPQLRVAEADSAEEAMEKLAAEPFQLVTTDLVLPERDGLWLIRRVRQVGTTPVLALTMQQSEAVIARTFEAGANGYILKTASTEQLRDAVRRVSAGERYLQPGLSEPPGDDSRASLSLGELELLHFHRKGLSEEALRECLRLSAPSYASRVRSLCRKLQAADLAGAVQRALEECLLVGDVHRRA